MISEHQVCPDRCICVSSLWISSLRAWKFYLFIYKSVLHIDFGCLHSFFFPPSGFVNFKKRQIKYQLLPHAASQTLFDMWHQCCESVYKPRACLCLGAALSSHDSSVFVRVFIGKVVTEAAVLLTLKPGDKTHEWTVTSSSPCCDCVCVTVCDLRECMPTHTRTH